MSTSALKEQGWHLTEEGIAECVENGNKSAQAIIKAALDIDLRQIGEKYIPDDINRGRVDYIQGPCVLQVQKIRNISAPKDNEDSQAAPRLLKLTLTDGHTTCSGVEIETIHTVSLVTPPGTKIQFSGTIPIENGFLLLNGKNTKSIGGRVERLHDNWELKRRLAKQHRRGIISEGGPPPFVPFGQKVYKTPIRTDNFKSLEIAKEKKESEEFEIQRRATIAEAVQAKEEKKVKSFGSNKQPLNDKDIARLVDMGFSTEHACQALRQNNGKVNDAIASLLGKSGCSTSRDSGARGNTISSGQLKTTAKLGGEKPDKFQGRERKGRKKNEEKETGHEDVAPSRPSGPATLFDFLETKMPLKDDTKSHNDRKTSDSKKDTNCDSGKFDADGRQNSDGRKGAGNRRNNLPPRLSGKSNNSNSSTGQSQANSANYMNNNYSSGPGYNNSGDGGGGSNPASLPYSNISQSKYGSNNTRHDYSASNHNQQQNRYTACNSSQNNYSSNNPASVKNCGIIGNHQQQLQQQQQQQSSGNYHNAVSAGGDSALGNGTTRVLNNNAPNHYIQSQHRYNNNNNNNSTSSHNKLPAYQGYHGDSRPNMRSPRNFSNSTGQIQSATPSPNYLNLNVSGHQQSPPQQQQQQHYTNEINARYSSYNPKDFHPQNVGSDNPNKIVNRDYQNHHQQQKQQQQQQFSTTMKQPRKVLNNLNVADLTRNESRQFAYENIGGGGGGGGHHPGHHNSTSRPPKNGPGMVDIGVTNRRRPNDVDSADHHKYDRKNKHPPNPQSSSHHWCKGDRCLAKYWEDKKFYPAIIESVPDLPTCVVTFIEYGNTEEVMLTDIKPIPKNWHELSKLTSNSHGKVSTGHQGFHNTDLPHSGSLMSHHQHIPMTPATMAAVAAAAQQQMTTANSQYSAEPLMLQQSHISTMEFRRGGGGGGPAYARRIQQQQQMMILQEKIKSAQQFYMPPVQRVMKQ